MPTPPSNKRYSRQLDMSIMIDTSKSPSRPSSPPNGSELRQARQRYGQSPGYVSNPGPSGSGRHPGTPPEPQSARLVMAHTRNNSSMDGSLMAGLPQGQDVIRVISTQGVTKVVKIAGCNTCEEVMRVTLRKFAL